MNEEIKNSGVLPEDPRPIELKQKDFIAGAETAIKYQVNIESGDWTSIIPVRDIQLLDNGKETMACTHFSVGQHVERYLMHLWETGQLDEEEKEFLKQYMVEKDNYKTIATSKRFNAIMGGNTTKGNYFQKAWENARKENGLIPFNMLKKAGSTWEQYHDRNVITPEMLKVGDKFMEKFAIFYDFVAGFDRQLGYSDVEIHNTQYYLKQSPLNIGIPLNINHSIVQLALSDAQNGVLSTTLEHYDPILRVNDKRPVALAIRAIVVPRRLLNKPIEKPIHYFAKDMQFGDTGSEVEALQKCLQYLGYLSKDIKKYGNFGHLTRTAVIKLQNDNPNTILKPAKLKYGTGLVKSLTRNYLNNLFQK